MKRVALVALVAAFAACSGGGEKPADGGGSGNSSDAGVSNGDSTEPERDGGPADAGGDGGARDTGIRKPEPPRFLDWECPAGWAAEPALVDEDGKENAPEGVAQFNLCRPPDDWNPAAAPVFSDWTCPPGWNSVPGFSDEDGAGNPPEGVAQFQACEPPALPECPNGMVASVGETACHTVGTECPAGEFLDEADIRELAAGFEGRVWYVKAGAGDGDGSRANPFGTIAGAVAAGAGGDIVALSKGTFGEPVLVGKSLAVVGSCAPGTTVAAPDADVNKAVIEISGAGTALVANLRVTGGRMGIWVYGKTGTSVTIESVEVAATTRTGILFSSGQSSGKISRTVVRDTASAPADKTGGFGLVANRTAGVAVTRSVFERNRSNGVMVTGAGGAVTLVDSAIRATEGAEASGTGGQGLFATDDATVAASRFVASGNRYAGVDVRGGAAIEIEDAFVSDTRPQTSDANQGINLQAVDGGTLTLRRAVVSRGRFTGIHVFSRASRASSLVAEDLIVRDTTFDEGLGTYGPALVVWDRANATLKRAVFDRNMMAGVETSSLFGTEPPTVTLTDVAIRDTRPDEATRSFGCGIDVSDGAMLSAERILLERNRAAGLSATIVTPPAAPVVTLTDATIRDTQADEYNSMLGVGVLATDGAQVRMERAMVERNTASGIQVFAAALDLDRSVVRDTLPQVSDGSMGTGLDVNEGASVTVTESVFLANRTYGVFAGDSALAITDAVVSGTLETDVPEGGGGWGLVLENGATLDARRVLVERNGGAGVMAAVATPDAGAPRAAISDMVVRDTLAKRGTGGGGIGLVFVNGGEITVKRIVCERNRRACIIAGRIDNAPSPLTIDVSDTLVRDMESEESYLGGGRGLSVQDVTGLTVTRALFERVRENALIAFDSPVEARDIAVRDVRRAACGDLDAGDPRACIRNGINYGGGTGLAALMETVVTVDAFEISGCVLNGIQIARDGSVSATDGEIHHNAIGLNVQVEGYDLETVLTPTVRFHENDTNVDSKDLPVPDPADLSAFVGGGE
ncbi:MAG: right-handed parallel beta-helix repeat-containing protein [Deltaproteobacteria bacterium]|nr:right-handed parallel beta-helix repeat-containing protein [Deltaproteobacteria bacterium]